MNDKEHILIAGGGPVGCLLGIALTRQGFRVSIHEKRPDIRKTPEEKGRSINLVLTSRALNALKELGLLTNILSQTVAVSGRMIHSKDGAQTFQPYGSHPEECNYSVSRNNINRVLLDRAEREGIQIFFESELEVVNFYQKKATFNDVQYSYDRLVGADGAGSTLRKLLIQSFPDEYQKKTDWLEWGYKELYMPPSELGDYPIRGDALHIWPRGSSMLMGLANFDRSFTMTLYLPKDGENSCLSLNTRDKVSAFFIENFSDAYNLIQRPDEDFLKYPHGRLGTTTVNKWVWDDSVFLVGDAAHTMVPFFGQGLNFSFEDCSLLYELVSQHNGNWTKILGSYDKIQRPNGNAICSMALENFVEMKDKVSKEHFLLKKNIERTLETHFPKMFRSRYGHVTYTLNQLKDIQELGVIQEEVLEELSLNLTSGDELRFDLAEKLLETKVHPFILDKKMSVERFSLR